jgi:hypothetical protein
MSPQGLKIARLNGGNTILQNEANCLGRNLSTCGIRRSHLKRWVSACRAAISSRLVACASAKNARMSFMNGPGSGGWDFNGLTHRPEIGAGGGNQQSLGQSA